MNDDFSTALQHINNLTVCRDEFISHWHRLHEEEDGLNLVAAAMGWISGMDIPTEYSGDYLEENYVIANTALSYHLQNEIVKHLTSKKIQLKTYPVLWNAVQTFCSSLEKSILSGSFGSIALAEIHAQQAEEQSMGLDDLIVGTISDDDRLYLNYIINDLVENVFSALDASSDPEDADLEDDDDEKV